MGLADRDYMQPEFQGRARPGPLHWLRFRLWLLWRRLRDRFGRRA